jgi:hypothetical protein
MANIPEGDVQAAYNALVTAATVAIPEDYKALDGRDLERIVYLLLKEAFDRIVALETP